LLSRARYARRCPPTMHLEVWRERPFVVKAHDRLNNSTLLSGRFDRLVFGRDLASGRAVFAEVIDFKTSERAVAFDHEEQLNAYRLAAGTLLGLPVESVSAEIVIVPSA
jgi:hypothetical protein